MNLEKYIGELFEKENIELYASVSLSDCKIIRRYLLEREGLCDVGTVFIFAVPYYSRECDVNGRNISIYSVGRDYHLFFSELYGRMLPALRAAFPENKFGAYSDHSPIDEVGASAVGGIGIIGRNHLMLTEKYSSFVFLGEIVTDAVIPTVRHKVKYCENCGLCEKACPVDLSCEECLSALTQKKGELSEDEKQAIFQNGSAWGCDLCQLACPYTKRAISEGTIFTPVAFYNENCTPILTSSTVKNMSDEEFSERAYSWRGRQTVLRNLQLFEK